MFDLNFKPRQFVNLDLQSAKRVLALSNVGMRAIKENGALYSIILNIGVFIYHQGSWRCIVEKTRFADRKSVV